MVRSYTMSLSLLRKIRETLCDSYDFEPGKHLDVYGAVMRRTWISGVVALMATGALLAPLQGQAQEPAAAMQPTFKSSVSLVSVNAVVKDRRGRPVRNLKRDDFQILENGSTKPIVDFGVSDQGAVSFGVLVDQSGSMALSGNLNAAREVIRHLLAW
ncbi:MAG TPA: hypothetical protein VMF13_11510, partial [Luteitalea sp.]|nr:hypothetical protein [Luteitalea sp.]